LVNPIVKAWQHWSVPLVLMLLAGLVVWFAPDEQTLGSGIKAVYVHVALIWTGMAGLMLLAPLGIALLGWPNLRGQGWIQTLGWVALAFFMAGLGTSVIAARVNWGDVFWQEPRNAAMLKVVAVALIVLILTSWPLQVRLKGLLYLGLTGFLVWSLFTTELILHPRNPIQSSTSNAIQGTFGGVFVLCALLGVWLISYFQSD